MSETQTEQQWMEGFVKAANEAGIVDPDEVGRLMVFANRSRLADKHAEAFEAGFIEAGENAGIEKQGNPLLATLAAGAGIYGLNRWRNSGNQWNETSSEDADRAYKQHKDSNWLVRSWNRMMGGDKMRAVKQRQDAADVAYDREQDPYAYNAYADKKQQKAQTDANAWSRRGGGGGGSRPSRYYRNYYEREPNALPPAWRGNRP